MTYLLRIPNHACALPATAGPFKQFVVDIRRLPSFTNLKQQFSQSQTVGYIGWRALLLGIASSSADACPVWCCWASGIWTNSKRVAIRCCWGVSGPHSIIGIAIVTYRLVGNHFAATAPAPVPGSPPRQRVRRHRAPGLVMCFIEAIGCQQSLRQAQPIEDPFSRL